MGQNSASLHFTAEQWAERDGAIGVVEALRKPMLVVPAQGRRSRPRMGDGLEPFCHSVKRAMDEHPRLTPIDVDRDEMARDLASHDALALGGSRIERVAEKPTDTDVALGSDVMGTALRGYARLKLNGRAAVMEGLPRDLGKRFEKSPRKKPDMGVRAR